MMTEQEIIQMLETNTADMTEVEMIHYRNRIEYNLASYKKFLRQHVRGIAWCQERGIYVDIEFENSQTEHLLTMIEKYTIVLDTLDFILN